MALMRLTSTGDLIPAGTPRRDTRRGRHREPGRAWRSTARWQRLRAQVIAAQPWCSACGTTRDLTVDHIHPVSRGGARFDPTNCRTLCRTCNSSKGAG